MIELQEEDNLSPADDGLPAELGAISVRVVVLPPKESKNREIEDIDQLTDIEPEESFPDTGSSPLGSYLESSKGGRRCCVFLVNGQRQDWLDNSYIVQDLGLKYLRNRVMVIVDIDGLAAEAIGQLMQGSRQGFYKGSIWNTILRKITAILKSDPDLLRLEAEAEERVAQLEAGDEKVRQTLDQLIESHHASGQNPRDGLGPSDESNSDNDPGLVIVERGGVVSLRPQTEGEAAVYPVLVSRPSRSRIQVNPGKARSFIVESTPSDAWAAIGDLRVGVSPNLPGLTVERELRPDSAIISLTYEEQEDFDEDEYPMHSKLQVLAAFNGIEVPRELVVGVTVKSEYVPPDPILLDDPTILNVTTKEPVQFRLGADNIHVRLRWDGEDHLLMPPNAPWSLSARMMDDLRVQPIFGFSTPNKGRIQLLITPRPEWEIGEWLECEVVATGPNGKTLRATFVGEVAEEPLPPERVEKEPRLVEHNLPVGSSRRPPYDLKYIDESQYDVVECWGNANWTDSDPGCFREPTDRTPLTLIINKDMGALREYRRYLTSGKKYTESEIERRISKYTSHVAFHLYQMYQTTADRKPDDIDAAETARREEIQRVAMTLIRLMQVSR